MLAVIGTFRLAPGKVAEAMPRMREVIEATLQETGCRAYSYAEDVTEAALFHVMELWESRAAPDAHFTTPHMRAWGAEREAFGFRDRCISLFPLGDGEEL